MKPFLGASYRTLKVTPHLKIEGAVVVVVVVVMMVMMMVVMKITMAVTLSWCPTGLEVCHKKLLTGEVALRLQT